MPDAGPPNRTNPRSQDEAVAELRRLQAELTAANPDMTDEDWDDLAERWAADVRAGLADRVRMSREGVNRPE